MTVLDTSTKSHLLCCTPLPDQLLLSVSIRKQPCIPLVVLPDCLVVLPRNCGHASLHKLPLDLKNTDSSKISVCLKTRAGEQDEEGRAAEGKQPSTRFRTANVSVAGIVVSSKCAHRTLLLQPQELLMIVVCPPSSLTAFTVNQRLRQSRHAFRMTLTLTNE